MEFPVLLKGIIMGFSIAAPVGPIGVLCIRRTIANGRLSGFVSGLGAATADGLYGCVAAFGLTFISGFLVSQQFWLRIVGGLFLLYLGVRVLLSHPAEKPADLKTNPSVIGDYLSTFFLTITNPMTILSFAAVFAGLGLSSNGSDYSTALQLVSGVVIGSAAWWLSLSGIVGFFRQRFNLRAMLWVNRISGAIIIAFGLWAVVGLLFPMMQSV
jgi:threonine/homoserine/homoserine lactone efflux protein